MNANHSSFFERPDGAKIEAVVRRPELISQYVLLSRLGIPAIQAVVWDIEPVIANYDEKTRNFAIQSTGALIGEILSFRGFQIARDENGEKRRGRVRKARFVKTGTVWEEPANNDDPKRAKIRAIMDQLLVEYRDTLTALAK